MTRSKFAVGPIVSQAKHLHIVQSAGKDVSVLVDAAILDHRVLASTDSQMGAGDRPRQRGPTHRRAGATLTVAWTCRIIGTAIPK